VDHAHRSCVELDVPDRRVLAKHRMVTVSGPGGLASRYAESGGEDGSCHHGPVITRPI
jgi:hypothetical protein